MPRRLPFVQGPEVRCIPFVQGPKVRGIDDLTELGVNSTIGTSNKLWLLDTDSIAPTIRLLEDIIVKGMSHITLRSGVIKSFRLHPSWLQVPWQGKVTDLSQAYKQLFVSLKDRWAAVISVFDPNSIPTRSEQNFSYKYLCRLALVGL